VNGGGELCACPEKAWPPLVAEDAGAMQIRPWEGAALSRAETVLQGTIHDTVRAGIGYGEKVSQGLWSEAKMLLVARNQPRCAGQWINAQTVDAVYYR